MAAHSTRIDQPGFARAITPGASELDPRPIRLYIPVGGSITIGNPDGSTQVIAAVAGEMNIQPYKLTAAAVTVIGFFYE